MQNSTTTFAYALRLSGRCFQSIGQNICAVIFFASRDEWIDYLMVSQFECKFKYFGEPQNCT